MAGKKVAEQNLFQISMTSSSESNPAFVESTDDVTSDTFDIDDIIKSEKQNSKKQSHDEEASKAIIDIIKSKMTISKILSSRSRRNGQEYYVKYRNSSYKDCEWISEKRLLKQTNGKLVLGNFERLYQGNPPKKDFFPKEYTIPERVIGKELIDGIPYYAVKWMQLDYDEVTYELHENYLNDLIKEFEADIPPESTPEFKKPEPHEFKAIRKPEKSKSGKSLREYQLQGVNFLVNSWYNNKNPILADEMGLGKTCQASYFIKVLATQLKLPGPYLILAPLSTIPHWERELHDWTDLKILTFLGSKERRDMLKKYLITYPGTQIPKFDVLLTTFEYIMREVRTFRSNFHWRCLIIDEAHRLKNFDSKITNTMNNYNADFKVLLTGTPLQNNTKELWTLLNFLDTERFSDSQIFDEKFGKLQDAEQIKELQAILKPLMLRRLKGDVEKNIIPMDEVIIECGMTPHQKGYYQSIYTKNIDYLSRGAHKQNSSSLMNICMELRKVCNHPYLINGAEDQILIERAALLPNKKRKPANFENECLIRSAGKMILLDKLLVKLKKDGHRVLIFSQMTKMLDILEDYLRYKKYHYERIDGSVKTEDRQQSIDRFNDEKSNSFIFLLCTRAGGLGINLVSADTVVIYDSDWNPQNDIQATARCHRIGQKKKVTAYRFITANTYERKMFDIASLKKGLDTAVLETNKGDWKHDTAEIEKLLRIGAYYAFKDDENDLLINEEDIETIISKSKLIQHDANTSDGSTFSKAIFDIQDKEDIDVTDPDFWKKYIPEDEKAKDDVDDPNSNLSIAERLRLARGEAPIPPPAPKKKRKEGPPQHKRSPFKWTRQRINRVQQLLLKYGFGQLKKISEEFDSELPIEELRRVLFIYALFYKQYLTIYDSFIEDICNKSVNHQFSNFDKYIKTKFKDEFISAVGTYSIHKANRLSQLELINIALHEEDLSVFKFNKIESHKPSKNWNKDDDIYLINFVFQNGFTELSNTKYSQDKSEITTSLLTARFDILCAAVLKYYLDHQIPTIEKSDTSEQNSEEEKSENQELHIDGVYTIETAIWTAREHEFIYFSLLGFGYPSAAAFVQKTGFYSKPLEKVEEYITKLIDFCEKRAANRHAVIDSGILETEVDYDSSNRLIERIKFFEKVREYVKSPPENAAKGRDWTLINDFAYNGFLDMDTNPVYLNIFGPDLVEAKLFRKIQLIMNPPTASDRPAILPGEIADIQYNEDGTPILPAAITNTLILNNIGQVITDRPGFQSERYYYPAGFVSERYYASCFDIGEKIWYRNYVIDTGDDLPLFRVETPDGRLSWESTKTSNVWLSVLKSIEERKKEIGLPGNRVLSISGPEMFGFANPVVSQLINESASMKNDPSFKQKSLIKDKLDLKEIEKNAIEKNLPTKSSSVSKSKPEKQESTPLTLKFDFSKLIGDEKMKSQMVVIDSNAILQKNSLTVPIRDDKQPLKSAVEDVSRLI